MYLLAQYFRANKGLTPDWRLHGLRAFLVECRRTNSGLVRRFQRSGMKDAALNAVADLSTVGELVSLSIEGELARLERLFRDHLDKKAEG
jgi:hypothetical protein